MRIHTKEDFVNFIIDQKLNVKQVNELLKHCGFTVWFLDEDYTSEQIAEEVYKWLNIPSGQERPIFLPMGINFEIKQHSGTMIEFKQ
jgi:hypothetical protein